MSIISNTDLQAWGDKIAEWAVEVTGDPSFGASVDAGFDAANANIMSGVNSLFTYFGPGGTCSDGDVTADLLRSMRNLDETNPQMPARFLISSGIQPLLTDMNAHLARYAPTTPTLDAYLTSLNASAPTLRFHEAFYNHIATLSRKNVFVGTDTVLATFAATGSATGTYAHVAALSSHLAGAKLVVKNQGAVTTGATVSVTGKKLDGTTSVITAAIGTGTDNHETDLSSVLRLFYDVTAISITSATNGNVYEIVAKTDRDISAA